MSTCSTCPQPWLVWGETLVAVAKLTHWFSPSASVRALPSVCLLPQTPSKMKSLAFVSKPMLFPVSVWCVLVPRGMCWHSVAITFRNSTKDICTSSAKHSEWSSGAGWRYVCWYIQNMSTHQPILDLELFSWKCWGHERKHIFLVIDKNYILK